MPARAGICPGVSGNPDAGPAAGGAGPLRFAAFTSGCSYRALGERWLAEQQAAVEVHEVSSYHSMLACVASGRYVCLLPQSVLSLMTLPENCLSEPL